MKALLATTLFSLCLLSTAKSQNDTIDIHYFNDSTIAAIQTLNSGWGEAIAYNSSGEIIYKNGIRRVAGTATVTFSFHNNGSVKKAKYYSAPDGGIQWFRSEAYFDENGVKLSETTDSHDRITKILEPATTEVKCAALHKNEVIVQNLTRKSIQAVIIESDSSAIVLKPGNASTIKTYVSAEISQAPDQFMKIQFYRHRRIFNRNARLNKWGEFSVVKEEVSPDLTRYTYVLRKK